MKKGKMTFMSFGLLLLVTSCGVSSTINTIDPELLKESVNRISLKDEANYSTYYSYINRVNEARQDNYLSKSSRQEVMPEGGFELNNQIVEAEEVKKIDVEDVKRQFQDKIIQIQDELEDMDKERAMDLAKKSAKNVKEKSQELVDLAIEKGTPILRDAADAVREKAVVVTRDVLAKLEKTEKVAKKETK